VSIGKPALPKRLVPVFIALGVVGLLVYQLFAQAQIECRVCVTYKGMRKCATAAAPEKAQAAEEAQRSACSLLTSGVTEAFACPNAPPDEVVCKGR
jgi:hypothetical protein